jgi:hypothetical protein
MDPHHILRIRWDVPFTRNAWHVDRGRAFQQYRWSLFTRFTLPSLHRQRVPWRAWLWADRELAALHAELPLDDSRVRFVYDLDEEARSVSEAEPGRAFMIGRIDSDDMLAPEALAVVGHAARQVDAARRCLQMFGGCAYDEPRNRVLPWRHPSPAFVFRPMMGTDLAAGFPSFGGKHSHLHQESVHLATLTPPFCVVLHGKNLDNSPDRKYAKGTLPRWLDRDVRTRFGLPKRSGLLTRLVRAWS